MNENHDEMNENKTEIPESKNEKQNTNQEEKNTFASDILAMLKEQLKFYKILVIVLVVLLAATNVYHIWQWSQFDTVTVDSGDGYTNYVQGDNTGGVFNGTDQGADTQGRQIEGDTDTVYP